MATKVVAKTKGLSNRLRQTVPHNLKAQCHHPKLHQLSYCLWLMVKTNNHPPLKITMQITPQESS